jgi:Protein of unknown function (DUF2934)
MIPATSSEIKKIRRVSEVVGRALAVNKNTAPATAEQIRRRAYELYIEGGCQAGKEVEHWLQAESELNQSYQEGVSQPA